jgi:hypothetical protein
VTPEIPPRFRIEQVDPAQGTTPARVSQIHREQLAALERERGDTFWVLNDGQRERARVPE